MVGNQFLDNLVDNELVRKYATVMKNENGIVTVVIDFTKLDKDDIIGFRKDNHE